MIYRRFYRLLLLTLASLSFFSCDDGDITDVSRGVQKEGYVVRMTGSLTGFDTWPEKYDVVIAGFKEGASYATISKNVPPVPRQDFVLSGIESSVKTVELCVINSIRKRIVTFYSVDVSSLSLDDTIRIDLDALALADVSMYAAVQTGIFDGKSCTGCHGVSHSAASLDLTASHSYAQLVSVPSGTVPDRLRVQPGQAPQSVLYSVFADPSLGHLYSFHQSVITKPFSADELDLLRDWIDDGARDRK